MTYPQLVHRGSFAELSGRRGALFAAFLGLVSAAGCDSGARPGVTGADAAVDAGAADAVADSAGEGPASYVLCDGSDSLRFRAFYGGGGQEFQGSYVRIENGYYFLMVDGTCTFWLGGGWVDENLSRDRPILTGTLSATEAKALEAGVPMDKLSEADDCVGSALADAGERELQVVGSSVRCARTGTRFEAAWTAVTDTATAIRGRARPSEGALRIAVVEAAPPVGSQAAPYAWPLTLPFDSFLIDLGPGNPTGRSHLVMDAADATQLRALRDQYLADRTATPGIYASWDGLRVVAGGKHAFLFMRDALPYEDERGLIAF